MTHGLTPGIVRAAESDRTPGTNGGPIAGAAAGGGESDALPRP